MPTQRQEWLVVVVEQEVVLGRQQVHSRVPHNNIRITRSSRSCSHHPACTAADLTAITIDRPLLPPTVSDTPSAAEWATIEDGDLVTVVGERVPDDHPIQAVRGRVQPLNANVDATSVRLTVPTAC